VLISGVADATDLSLIFKCFPLFRPGIEVKGLGERRELQSSGEGELHDEESDIDTDGMLETDSCRKRDNDDASAALEGAFVVEELVDEEDPTATVSSRGLLREETGMSCCRTSPCVAAARIVLRSAASAEAPPGASAPSASRLFALDFLPSGFSSTTFTTGTSNESALVLGVPFRFLGNATLA